MARAVYASDEESGFMRFGLPTSGERAMLRGRLDDMARSHGLSDSSFFQRAIERFNSIDFDRIGRKIDSIRRKVEHLFDHDEIRPMHSIGSFQQAGPIQARWIMANPRAQRLFESDMIHGYRDLIKPQYPGRFGEDNPDYQEVMNGLPVFDEDGNSMFVQYLHLYDEDGRTQLSHGQQTAIVESIWCNFEGHLDRGLDDPSDPDNGSL